MFLKGRSASPSLFYTLKNRDMEKQVISPRSITSMPWVLWWVPCKTGSATQGGRRAFHPGTDSSLHEACRGGKLQWSWDLVESRQTNERWNGKLKEMWELSVARTGVTPPALQLALAGEKGAVLMTGLVWEAERRGKRVQTAVKEQQLVRHNSLQEVKERENTQGRLPWSIALRTMGRSQKIRERKELVCLTRKKEEEKKEGNEQTVTEAPVRSLQEMDLHWATPISYQHQAQLPQSSMIFEKDLVLALTLWEA